MDGVFRRALFAAALLLLDPGSTAWAGQVRCENGAYVDKQERCQYFRFYRQAESDPDPRVSSRLHMQNGQHSRSIALLVGVDRYAKISVDALVDGVLKPGHDLVAAAEDLDNLSKFFTSPSEQNFDEVVVLRNLEATEENIHYFLGKYILGQSVSYSGMTRVVFAYSGHGLQEDTNARLPPRLVLSSASSEYDIDNLLFLSSLNTDLRDLSRVSYQVLALVNACYGGSIFSLGSVGGSRDASDQPGSWAVTAGSDHQLVWSSGKAGAGSIFFEWILKGIRSGDADAGYAQVRRSSDGEILQEGGIVRLGHLVTYLDSRIQDLADANPGSSQLYQLPWDGPMQADADKARGGFFFLSPYKLAPGVKDAVFVQPGPVSGIAGRPDLQVYKTPEDYPIKGVDISHWDKIDWTQIASEHLRFVYMKATQGVKAYDHTFENNWAAARRNGLATGAYHYFDYCAPAEAQFANIVERLKPMADREMMPFAVDFETPGPDQMAEQIACAADPTMPNRLLSLLKMIEEHYAKVPVMFRIKSQVKTAPLDDRFLRYSLWISDWTRSSNAGGKPTGLQTPWTFWQASGRIKSAAFPEGVDRDVFYGTESDFAAFREGAANTALRTVVNAASPR